MPVFQIPQKGIESPSKSLNHNEQSSVGGSLVDQKAYNRAKSPATKSLQSTISLKSLQNQSFPSESVDLPSDRICPAEFRTPPSRVEPADEGQPKFQQIFDGIYACSAVELISEPEHTDNEEDLLFSCMKKIIQKSFRFSPREIRSFEALYAPQRISGFLAMVAELFARSEDEYLSPFYLRKIRAKGKKRQKTAPSGKIDGITIGVELLVDS